MPHSGGGGSHSSGPSKNVNTVEEDMSLTKTEFRVNRFAEGGALH